MTTATVEVLTAEVRTLMVGSRQVTLSVYRQLDWVDAMDIEPFGRVHDKKLDVTELAVVGRDAKGALVRASVSLEAEPRHRYADAPGELDYRRERWQEQREVHKDWRKLPLIVLAGLR